MWRHRPNLDRARVVWTKAALRGVARAHAYLAPLNPRAAAVLVDALLKAGDSLAFMPERGRLVPGTGMRELVNAQPYLIRYRISGQEVVILRIRHGARRPTKP